MWRQGGVIVGKALGANRSLLDIDMSMNGLDDDATYELAHSARTHSKLQSVTVAHNAFTGKGALVRHSSPDGL